MSLAIFSSPPVREAIATVAGLKPNHSEVSQGLAQLQQLSLISQNEDKRYSMLPLTRKYVLDELATNEDFQQAARERWLNWYLEFAQKNGDEEWKSSFNYDKLEEEEENLQAVLYWCQEQGRYKQVRDLWYLLYYYASLYGYWEDRLTWLEWLRKESEILHELSDFVQFTICKSWTLIRINSSDSLEEAKIILNQVWDLREEVDLRIKADLAESMARLYIRHQEYEIANEWLDREFKFVLKADLEEPLYFRYIIPVYYHQAEILFWKQQYQESKKIFSDVMKSAEKICWYRVKNSSRNWLADIAIRQEDFEEAKKLLNAGYHVAKANNNQRRVARYERSYARLELALGNVDKAREWANQALGKFKSLRMNHEAAEMEDFLNQLP